MLKGPKKLFPQSASYSRRWDPTLTKGFWSKFEQFLLFHLRDFYICVFFFCFSHWFEVGGA